jgi:nucleotide-binding universal stress UspA family protein
MEQPMSIKDLLVHVDQSPTTATRLDAALELGERFGAHVTALHLRVCSQAGRAGRC